MKRILALLLTVIMLFGTFAIDISAGAVEILYETKQGGEKSTEIDWEATLKQYHTLEFKTEQAKLESMTMMYEKDGYQLWIDDFTGEVATVCLATGQILFSNPYDIGSTSSSADIKSQLFSQVVVKYTDNDIEKYMYSFTDAASRGQIKFEYIKNGIRAEYSIGREETRMLVPRHIERSRFENNILQPFADEINKISEEQGYKVLEWRDYLPMAKRNSMIKDSGNQEWFKFVKLLAFYSEKFLGECETEKERTSMAALYPITKKMDIWVCTPDVSRNELITIEGYIKTYVPTYTFEELEKDHQLTEYEGQDKAPPLFKLALEYTLDEQGMSVRLPANGLRFDESLYQLTYVSILPYMGAGANYLLGDKEDTFTGYNFFPDGSGTLFRHEDLVGKANTVINGKVYGQDFAYNTITGTNQQIIRYPVFGIVSNTHRNVEVKVDKYITEEIKDSNGDTIIVDKEGNVVDAHQTESVIEEQVVNEDKGFVAIIEEGDALAELSNYHMGSSGKYNTVQMLFYPRPRDSYNLANAISVGANATWTVVSSRKYVGNYKIRYIMLTDDAIAEQNGIDDYYECSWMGMAEAYRDYLYRNGELDALTADEVQDDIPMYIETLGTLETLEKIMSIPVNVMTSLTSFENIKTMYDELSDKGVSNIKFKLTGYANGGLYSSVPYKLEWEKSVGGDKGFEDLLSYSADKGFEVFPEFDFAYVNSSSNTLFDGLTLKKHVVKSINDTYMSRRYYSATRQTHVGRFELAISAAYFSHFYDKLTENLMKNYEGSAALKAISVSTLGNNLNSDFDEDEPYNREDSKKYTRELFGKMDEDYDLVMTEGANAYTWKYVDYIINVPLDSSRYNMSANAVPFIGVVLHGSVEFAGTPLNMEGNIGYSMLKAIENGAGLNFMLCYENYEELKEDNRLSEYYSVRYDILKDDIVKYYTIINDLTKDLQLSKIIGHEFLIGERVPDADEVIADTEALKREEEAAAKLEAELAAIALQEALLQGRVYAAVDSKKSADTIASIYEEIKGHYEGAVIINASGIVDVRVGMKTLVALAQEKAALKAPLDNAYELANAWTKAYTPFYNNLVFTGSNQVRADLEKALSTALTNLSTAKAALPAKEAAIAPALEAAVSDKLKQIPTLVEAYNDAKTALDQADATAADYADKKAAADKAYADITRFVVNFEDAVAYHAADAAIKAAEAEQAEIKKALDEAMKNAVDPYEAKQTELAAKLQNNADYLAAVKALDDAEAAYDKLDTAYGNLVKKLTAFVVDYEGTYEHGLLLDTIAEYEVKMADAQAAIKVAAEAVDAYYIATDAGFAALKTAADNASAIVESGYMDNAEYAAQQAIIDANAKIIADLDAKLAGDVKKAYETLVAEFNAILGKINELKAQQAELEFNAYNDAEYAKHEATAAEKQAALAAITDAYVNDPIYKQIIEKLTAPIDAKIDEAVAKIANAAPADQIKIAGEIASLLSVKYQKVTVPKTYGGEDFNVITAAQAEKNADGLYIGAGYILNDYITKYKKACETNDEYKAAKAAYDAAKTAPGSYKQSKISSVKNSADYKAIGVLIATEEANYKAHALDNKALRDALVQVDSSNTQIANYEKALADAQAKLDAAEKYTGVDSFVKVLDAYNASLASDRDIITKYTAANTAYKKAFGDVKSRITSVNILFNNFDKEVNNLNVALKNSDIAKAYYGSAEFQGVYSQEFIAALENVYNETLVNTKAGNAIVDQALELFVAILKLAQDVIPNNPSDVELTALRIEIKDDNTIVIPEIEEVPEEEEEETEEEEGEPEYEYTKYTDDSGNIVCVEYDNGTYFILNYNDFDVTVVYNEVTYTISTYGGVKVTADGNTKYFKATEIN